MSKAYSLSIANVVKVPVKVKINDADGKEKDYKFSLICQRLGTDESIELFKTLTPLEVMKNYTTGWDGQRLVMEEDDDGKKVPAEFCLAALLALFDIQGLLMVCFNAYVQAMQAVVKT